MPYKDILIGMFQNEIRLAPIVKKENIDVTVDWFFPNTYEIGMSGLGYQLVWWLFEQDSQVSVRRGFTDREESGTLGEKPDLLGFTVSWELDFINIIKTLTDNNIDPQAHRREGLPLIFGGGPVLTANPEPFAGLFDVILLGDAEVMIPAFLAAYRKARGAQSRQEILFALSKTPGIYVPSLYKVSYQSPLGPIAKIEPVRAGVPDTVLKQNYTAPPDYAAHTQILSSETAWSNTFLIEVVRSCPQECRFCLASFLTRPFRATNIDTIIDKIKRAASATKRVGLLGPSVTEHPGFHLLAEKLLEIEGLDLTVASVRADTLTKEMLATFKKLGQRSVTIAIESGSERLRQVMRKNLSEAEILEAVRLIDESGLDGVKFYGIAGLPHEDETDLEATVELLKRLKKNHKRLRFVFGVSSFVPKAQTPFQWKGRAKNTEKSLEYLRKNLAKLGIEVRAESHNWSDIQALISRGDRRLWPALLQVAEDGGKIGAWKRVFRAGEIPGLDYYAFRDIDYGEVLPWSHLVDQTRVNYLEKHDRAAAKASEPLIRPI